MSYALCLLILQMPYPFETPPIIYLLPGMLFFGGQTTIKLPNRATPLAVSRRTIDQTKEALKGRLVKSLREIIQDGFTRGRRMSDDSEFNNYS